MLSEWPVDITVAQDGVAKDVKLARKIQQSLQMDTSNLLHLLVRHGEGECTILLATFEHSKLNGMQVMMLLRERAKELMECFSSEANGHIFRLHKYIFVHKKAPLLPGTGAISIQDVLCAHIFEASYPSMKVREIYKEIFRLFASNFFMCIDVSHLFGGEPCILRISFYWERDFDEQWDEMITLKKSKGMVMSTWRQHLETQERWASHLPQTCPEVLPVYGSTEPLKTSEVASISAVAFSLQADRSGCFFTFYPGDVADSMSMQSRFHSFKDIFGLSPSKLQVRPAPDVSAEVRSNLEAVRLAEGSLQARL